ncbi:MAG: DUF1016 domain-containing protein, partial [Oscillospiraceae bacterium]|nr:DUF1016 domain-containing protein [Oscillospiraceae bacterium]
VSDKTAAAGWGKSVASDFSAFLRSRCPSAKVFFAQNIWRMKQFYETYRDKKLSPLVREISWTNNLLSLSS